MVFRRASALLVVSAFLFAACSSSGSTPATNSSGSIGDSNPTSAGHVSLPPVGGGSCSVKVTGGTEVSWQSPQDKASLVVSYWLSSAERALLSLTADQEYFLMNCQSAKGTLSFYTTTDTTHAQFPEAPGDYVIEAGGVLGDTKAGEVKALVTFPDKTLWRVTENGTFAIASFNGSHIAGTFTFKIGKESEDLQSIVATATVAGTFDMACTSGACK
ncbi:MAG: hypothetical protein ABSB75_00565 [Candidatus Limnocylindrales bacterium]